MSEQELPKKGGAGLATTANGPSCMRFDCDDPATTRISPPYGRDWLMCGDHAPGMATALGHGLPQSLQVVSSPLGGASGPLDPPTLGAGRAAYLHLRAERGES
jgi:hypothetical protein